MVRTGLALRGLSQGHRHRTGALFAAGARQRARHGHVVVGYESGSHAYDPAVPRLRAGECIAILPEAGGSAAAYGCANAILAPC